MAETGVLRKIQIEATGGHHELQSVLGGIYKAVEELRREAARQQFGSALPSLYDARASINLEGTIKVETEDDL